MKAPIPPCTDRKPCPATSAGSTCARACLGSTPVTGTLPSATDTILVGREALDLLVKQVVRADAILRVGPAHWVTTKGPAGVGTLVAIRSFPLERAIADALASAGEGSLLDRLARIDPTADQSPVRPSVLVRLISRPGPDGPVPDVFVAANEALGVRSTAPGDQIAIEFLDVWDAIIRDILAPIVIALFDRPSAELLIGHLSRCETVPTASVLHELGHRAFPTRVIPGPDPRFAVADPLLLGTFSELGADAVGHVLLPAASAPPAFNLLYRTFYYGRWDTGGLRDVDSLTGAYLFGRMMRTGALQAVGARLHYDEPTALSVWADTARDVGTLSTSIGDLLPTQQNAHLQAAIAQYVPLSDTGQFALPPELAAAFATVHSVPLVPRPLPWLSAVA